MGRSLGVPGKFEAEGRCGHLKLLWRMDCVRAGAMLSLLKSLLPLILRITLSARSEHLYSGNRETGARECHLLSHHPEEVSLPQPMSLETHHGGVDAAGREALSAPRPVNCGRTGAGHSHREGKAWEGVAAAVPDSVGPRNVPLGLPALLLPRPGSEAGLTRAAAQEAWVAHCRGVVTQDACSDI